MFTMSFLVYSCEYGVKSGNELSKDGIEFIRNLEILDENETIIQFHSQSGESDEVKQAGNFYTEKRIASYWIDRNNESETKINSAFYSQIDTILQVDNTKNWSAGSFLKVKTSESGNFRVYINGDSAVVLGFFDGVMKEWNEKKATNTVYSK